MRASAVAVVLAAIFLVSSINSGTASTTSSTSTSSTLSGTVGFYSGDTAVFEYDISSVTQTPQGGGLVNVTTTLQNQFSLQVLNVYVNASEATSSVAYLVTFTEVNSTTVETPEPGKNLTTIFNPYDNNTYLGQIGFLPFTYTNLPAGEVRNLEIVVPFPNLNGSGGTVYVPEYINASVVRNAGEIQVDFSVKSGVFPWSAVMRYSPVTGLLENGTITYHYSGLPFYLTYTLLEYDHPIPLDLSILPYVAVALVVVIVVYSLVTRKSKRERKVERLQKKLGRRT